MGGALSWDELDLRRPAGEASAAACCACGLDATAGPLLVAWTAAPLPVLVALMAVPELALAAATATPVAPLPVAFTPVARLADTPVAVPAASL
jgi:hypothetical protein